MTDLNHLTRGQLLNIWRKYRESQGLGVGDYARQFPKRKDFVERLPSMIPSDTLAALVAEEVVGQPEALEPQNDADAAFAQLVRRIAGDSINESRVKAIVAEALRSNEVKTTVEYKRWDGKVTKVTGAHPLLPRLLQFYGTESGFDAVKNAMLVGPAGCGKTTLAQHLHTALGYEGKACVISCSGGQTESKLLGRILPTGDNGTWKFVAAAFIAAIKGPCVILLDEWDAADPNVALSINAALANRFIVVETENGPVRFDVHPGCVILAAANTFGHGADMVYVGRNQLDGASLDRFKIFAMDYDNGYENALATNPDEKSFVKWAHGVRTKSREFKLRRVVSTRLIQRGLHDLRSGVDFATAKVEALVGWTAEETRKVAA